jgi:hypothetical protein
MAAQTLKLAGKQFVIVPRKEYALLQRKAQLDQSGTRKKTKTKTRSARGIPPVEIYTDERVAEFLLSNSVDADDYSRACEEVRRMGLDPAKIAHTKPTRIA